MAQINKDTLLILIPTTSNAWDINAFCERGYHAYPIFKDVNKFLRAIRRIGIMLNLPLVSIGYSKGKKTISKYDNAIVFVGPLNIKVFKYLKKKNKAIQQRAGYGNTVEKATTPTLIPKYVQKGSFDNEDCKKYNLNFAHQFYFKNLIINSKKKEYDVYCCMNEAGREDWILLILGLCKKLKLNSLFQIVNSASSKIPKDIKSEYLDYFEIRKNIAQSGCLIEINRANQTGPTLRAMEAIFFQKKLMTNNLSLKEEEFYNPNNIFIINNQTVANDLRSFLNKPYVMYKDSLLKKYDISYGIEELLG